MKEKDEDIEQMLLNNASLDDLIKVKIGKEFKEAQEKENQKPQQVTICDISKVPSELIFSKKSVFKIFNKKTKIQTLISGLQAEALLGIQNSVREKMLRGKTASFATDDAYVKFEKVTINEKV